ncbi:MAG: hypothetical protein CMJ18_18160 [Phycisphaeraceae bacterium]|nr:hypothetical protein [Phycisphaeraceae bacterium]
MIRRDPKSVQQGGGGEGDGWMGGWVDGWLGGWVDGWLGGWVVGWLGGWVSGTAIHRGPGVGIRQLSFVIFQFTAGAQHHSAR